jgi:outer membrane cobalamin receptor
MVDFRLYRRRLRRRAVLVCALVAVTTASGLAGPSTAFAAGQAVPGGPSDGASIAGAVTDPDGARVPGALIVLAGATAVVATVQADAHGEFRLERVAAGRYELRVAAEGFHADPVSIVVTAGQALDVPVRLHVSAVTESVVVSASQVEVPLGRAADSVTVLSAADLRATQVETVADALRDVAGLTVARTGGRGALTSLFPRGGESDYTLVLVDGVKANSFGGGYDFSTLTATGIERVEVVRGPESALFGADAIGAVVQVITKEGGRPRAEGLLEAGSFGTDFASAGSYGSRGAFRWGGSVERVASQGFTGLAPGTGERVSNDDFLEKHVAASGGWHADRVGDFRATANVSWSDCGYPGPFGSDPIGAYTGVDRISRGATTAQEYGLRWTELVGSGSHQVRQTVSVTDLDFRSDYTSPDFYTGLPTVSFSSTSRQDARTQTDVDLSTATSLSVGAEWQREQASSTYITNDTAVPVPVRRQVIGLFAEARFRPTTALTVTTGVRAEWLDRDALAADPVSAERPAFGADTETSVNPRLSAAYVLGDSRRRGWTRVHAAAGTGIRAPDAFEIAFTDNPGLKPERSRSVEAGVDQAVVGEALVVGGTFFDNRYDDLIVTVGSALKNVSPFRSDNISNAQSRGLEVSSALRTRGGLEARAAYTFLDTEILAANNAEVAPSPFAVGQPLLRRPRHAGSLELIYARQRLTAFSRLGARTRTLEPEPNYGTAGGLFYSPGYGVVDAGASVRVASAVEVVARVGNVLDHRYEETLGYPALGRNAMIGVRLAAGR